MNIRKYERELKARTKKIGIKKRREDFEIKSLNRVFRF